MRKSSAINSFLASEADPSFARRAEFILSNLDLKSGDKVLEVGCGRGFYLKAIKNFWPKSEVYGLDLNKEYLLQAKKNTEGLEIKLTVADARKLPFKNNFFDRIIASEILEHIPDDELAMAEIYRVLKPGGVALITVPNKNYPFLWDPVNWILEKTFNWHVPSNIWWLAGIWADHRRLYDGEDIVCKLKGAKFKIGKLYKTTQHCFPFSHFLLYGVGKNIVEKGLMPDFNRFGTSRGQSSFNKILLWPLRLVDALNVDNNTKGRSVNIVLKVSK